MSVPFRAVLVAGAAAAALAVPASAASAEPADPCVGTQNTLVYCVDPSGSTYYSDCVYLGGSSCTQVTVNGPYFTCTGPMCPQPEEDR